MTLQMNKKGKIWKLTIMLLFIATFSFLTLIIKHNWSKIPPHWNPWAPLTINQPINLITKWKLNNLKQNPDECLQILSEVYPKDINYKSLRDYTPVEGCPLTNVIKIKNTGVKFNREFILSCPLTVAWLMFEQQSLQPLAKEVFGKSVDKINHYGSFACRNINNSVVGKKSEHATASALDIAGLKLSDGRTVSVLKHWDNENEAEKSDFLFQFKDGACKFFGTVLGPEYNSLHANHFHIDSKNTLICR